jgi:hypothetical protein
MVLELSNKKKTDVEFEEEKKEDIKFIFFTAFSVRFNRSILSK